MDVIIDVPTNLGLRPPAQGCVPGADKAPAALRDAGLHAALVRTGWLDAGRVVPGRYRPEVTRGQIRNEEAVVSHAGELATRLQARLGAGDRALVLGGDCSVLLGVGIALRRHGRFGLVHIDGHTDFRHPGNSSSVASLGGEDLAAVCGLHYPTISDIDGLRPYVDPRDGVHIGCRDDDEDLQECRATLGDVIPASQWSADPLTTVERIRSVVDRPELTGYWIHVDVDVLDPAVFAAVDSPDPGGVEVTALTSLLSELWSAAAGMTLCIYDPDLDPDRSGARLLTRLVVTALG